MRKQRTIILASTSPRRRELMKKIGLPFKAVSGHYEEDMTLPMKPEQLAIHLSRGKAEVVAKKYTDAIVIAADTFVVLNGKVLGKPHTAAKAKQMLTELSGSRHRILTGLTVIDTQTGKRISRVSTLTVYFKKLSPQEIAAYVKSGEPLERAGAYAIQGGAAVMVKKMEGDYFAALGLSLYGLTTILQSLGVFLPAGISQK